MSRSHGLIFASSPGCLCTHAGVAGLLLLREFLVSGNQACWLMLELGENGLEGRCLSPTSGLCVKSAVESDMKLGINILSVLFSFSSVFDSMGVCPLLIWRHPSAQSNLVWLRLAILTTCKYNHVKSSWQPPEEEAISGFWMKTWH